MRRTLVANTRRIDCCIKTKLCLSMRESIRNFGAIVQFNQSKAREMTMLPVAGLHCYKRGGTQGDFQSGPSGIDNNEISISLSSWSSLIPNLYS